MKVLRNNGKRRLGIPGRPAIILAPGEFVPVDDNQIKDMHKNRTIVRWLKRDVLELIDESDIKDPPRKKAAAQQRSLKSRPVSGRVDKRDPVVLPDGITGTGVELHHKGGGWYEVYVNGFVVTDKNVRKDEAEQIATEYE